MAGAVVDDGSASPPRKRLRDADDAEQQAIWTRLEHGISADASPPAPVESFERMGLPLDVLRVLQTRGIATPTAIQLQAIPAVLSGRDVIGLAATGSGKSLCFLLPLLALLARERQHAQQGASQYPAAPTGLLVAPTRELMEQLLHELGHFVAREAADSGTEPPQWLLRGAAFSVLGACGGVSLQHQVTLIRQCVRAIEVVVATPGRLLHLVEHGSVSLHRLRYLVFDEVDRMLDIEMEPQLRRILARSNAAGRQTLLWSATLPPFLDRLARSAVLDPVTIRVGGIGRRLPVQITQSVLFMRFAEKKQQLLQALRATPAPPVLVFCNARESVDFVARVLQSEQFHAAPLHGDKSQAYRFQVLAAFREGFVDVLVATDVAARGLDFADVEHVIIFDMPHSIEDYVHRCGRTGRRQQQQLQHQQQPSGGRVTAFLTVECSIAAELKQLLEETKQSVPRELEVPSRFQSKQTKQHVTATPQA
ncbi:hypothetical protein PybrP1_007113 [[Pythium] brassicae (nom. inval.)]|nr:hypothetical protein PybrP1_007113 [[Pythium] brassicae (nom. inval.)]